MKKIFLSVLSLVLVLSVFGCGKKETKKQTNTKVDDDNIYASTIENLIKTVEVDGFRIDNISLVYENNETILMANVTNTSDNIIDLDYIKAIYTDSSNNEYTLVMSADSQVVPFQTVNTVSKTDDDLTKCVNVRYEVVVNPETH